MGLAALKARRGWLYALLLALVATDVAIETNVPRLHVQPLQAALSASGGGSLRVLHVSDLHARAFPDDNRAIKNLVTEAYPDMAVITGDLIDHRTPRLDEALAFIDVLRARVPAIYYVSGNHEWGNALREPLLEALAERGVTVLNNRHVVAKHGAFAINVCGVDDAYTGHDDLTRALAGVDGARFTLLISHSPAPARRLAGTPVDLMLAGHTHGGQVRLPLVGALWAPGEGFLPAFDKGLYPLPEDKQLYIDSGLGTSILPLRFLNRSQMSLLVLRRPAGPSP